MNDTLFRYKKGEDKPQTLMHTAHH
jgi:hypothetical protein